MVRAASSLRTAMQALPHLMPSVTFWEIRCWGSVTKTTSHNSHLLALGEMLE